MGAISSKPFKIGDCQGRRNVGRAGGQKKSWGQYKIMKNKKIVTDYLARRLTRRGDGGLFSSEKKFTSPWKNVLDIF